MHRMFFGAFTINLFDPQILFNDGFYDLVDVHIPEGCILKPKKPAALSCRTGISALGAEPFAATIRSTTSTSGTP